MNVRELRAKRAKCVADARALLDLAERENRELSAEEQQQYDRFMAEVDSLAASIEREERVSGLETELAGQGYATRPELGEGREGNPRLEERTAAFRSFLRTNELSVPERRALQADLDTAGGFIKPPQEFVSGLIKAMDNITYMLQISDVVTLTTSDSLGQASLEADPADAAWTAEIGAVSEDSTMAFGKRELNPKQLTKLLKVSRKLLRLTPSVESLVNERLAYKFGVTAENTGLNGSGAGQPLGVFTASNDGISTSRDVATGNTATAMTFDGLIEAKYALKGQYWRNARWIMHRTGAKQLRKIKDGDGQYIWHPSLQVGTPDMLLDLPLLMSEYAPSTFTNGLYVGILGDFKYYKWAIGLNMEMQRLLELYAATSQVGFVGRMEIDGMPVLEEAFVRVTLAP